MSKIQHFDRATCNAVREAVEKALRPVAEEFGLTLTMRGGSFMATNYSPKIEFAVQGEGGIVMGKEAESFKVNAFIYGLAPTDLGKSFTYGGQSYTITGLGKGKSPILAKRVTNGKTYKFPPDVVKALLARGGQS